MTQTIEAIDYTRQRDFFDPARTNAVVTIIGCGGIGSFAAFALAKLGVRTLRLLDFDTVEEHNAPNQMFFREQIGLTKVEALATTIASTSDTNVETFNQRLEDGIPISPIVISALDSMSARKALWEQVKEQFKIKLFIDGRIGGQNVVLYAARPTLPSDIKGYEATLHSDEEGDDLPCTGRAVIDVGFAIGSLITRAVRGYYAEDGAYTPITFLNQNTLELHKGGEWYDSSD